MLHIILLILKILGILILTVLGLILLCLCLLLFVPFKYRGEVHRLEKLKGRASLSWLFRAFRLEAVYDDRAVISLKILWFTLFSRQVFPVKDTEAEMPGREPEVRAADLQHDRRTDGDAGKREENGTVRPAGTEKTAGTEKPAGTEKTPEPEETKIRAGHLPKEKKAETEWTQAEDRQESGGKAGKPGLWDRIRNFILDRIIKKIRGIRERLHRLWDSLKKKKNRWKKKYRKARDFLENPENQKTFRLLCRQTGKLFRHLLPRKIRGRIRFGLEDPYQVGQILCLVSPFYGFYGKSFSLEPVFDEKVLQGEAEFRGHIRIMTLLLIALRVYSNKNFRILMKKWRT